MSDINEKKEITEFEEFKENEEAEVFPAPDDEWIYNYYHNRDDCDDDSDRLSKV